MRNNLYYKYIFYMLGGNIYELDNTITGLNTIWADTIQGIPAENFQQ